MNKHLTLSRLFAVVLLVLEAMPYGAVLYFNTPEEIHIRYFSYFDLTTYGNANFGPCITAFLTVVLAVFLVLMFFKDTKALRITASVISAALCAASLIPLTLGLRYMTSISWCISLVAACTCVLLCLYIKYSEKQS